MRWLLCLALGIGLGCQSQTSNPTAVKAIEAVRSTTAANEKTIRVLVPDMNCQHVCWPEVRNTLARQPGVRSVKLVAQPNPDEITHKHVLLNVEEGFDSDVAFQELDRIGFQNSKIISP
ncbi:MAG: hypothetical protein U0905_00010 [Pirellulales bacterium]